MRRTLLFLFIVSFFQLITVRLSAQSSCDSITPVFNVDLSGKPNGTWYSPAMQREGNCCGTVAPDKCLEFVITLDSTAVAINFQIASGAIPPGALYYQIGCGPQIAVGSSICLNGPGPYHLTFCKPGNNINSYAITSIAGPEVSPDDTIGNGCTTTMYASGLLQDSTIFWTSIYPGTQGAYNSYLSCTTDCDSALVTAGEDPPPFIDFLVCGRPAAGPCIPDLTYWCDTIRIHFTPPLIAQINPSPAIVCASDTDGIVLTGSFTGGAPPFSHQWTNVNGEVIGSDTEVTVQSGGAYYYRVLDKFQLTCPSEPAVVQVVKTSVNAAFTAEDVCLGSPVSFNNNTICQNGSVVSCEWNFGNFSQVSSDISPDYIYSAPGTFNVTLAVQTDNNCVSTVTNPVVVHPLPVANFSSTSVCEGIPVQFTSMAIVQGGDSVNAYLWAFGDGSPVSDKSDPSHLYFQSGIYNVSLVAISGEGCADTVTKPVVVYPAPVAAFNVSDTGSCEAVCIEFDDESVGTGVNQWRWSFGDGSLSSSLQNPSHCFLQSGNFAITLSVTSVNGCSSEFTDSIEVSIYPAPSADFSFGPQPATTLNPLVLFQDKSSGAAGWEWNFDDDGGSNTSFEQNPEHLFSDSGYYCVQLIVENEFQCRDTAVHCLRIEPEFTFFIPNAFTPGQSDALNDDFGGAGMYIKQYDLWIYDRWGDMIFHSGDIHTRWNGCVKDGSTLVQQDVYIYIAKVVDIFGREHDYKGKVTVVR